MRGITKRTLSLEEHRSLGAELKAVRDRLIDLVPALAGRYPKTGKTVRKAKAALKAVDALRCQLDDQAAKDLADAFDTKLYYLGPQDRET